MVSLRTVRAYLSLGSNVGPRESNLRDALTGLESRAVRVIACSSVYQTEPVGYKSQPDFLNLVCEIRTVLTPRRLLEACLELELELGRVRSIPKGPRTIDLDILLYARHVIDEPDLIIPHPRLYERAFVLVPLAEIAPGVRDPKTGLSVREMLERCEDQSRVAARGSTSDLKIWPAG